MRLKADDLSLEWSARSGEPCAAPPFPLQVRRLTWGLPGGPRQAVLSASLPASAAGLIDPDWALEMLRRPLTVTAAGETSWWGWVQRVELRGGRLACAFDLDGLSNRVAVQYWQRQPTLERSGEQRLTAWAEDGHSLSEYGRKERILCLPSIYEAQALAARNAWLQSAAAVSGQAAALSQAVDGLEVRLVCRGWWDSLDWVYAPRLEQREGFLEPAQTLQRLGRTTSDERLAQSFRLTGTGWWLNDVCVDGKVVGACSDALRLDVCADVGGVPGSALTSVSIPAAQISGGRWDVRFALSAPLYLPAETTYWLKLTRSGALDTLNYYQVYREDTNPYPKGQLLIWTGSAWSALAGGAADLNFSLGAVQPLAERIALLAGPLWGGQFLNGVHFVDLPGGYAPLWKSTELTCREELEGLLTSAGGLQAHISAGRVLEIHAPAGEEAPRCRLELDGSLVALDGRALPVNGTALGTQAWAAPGWLDQRVPIDALEWTPSAGLRVG